MNSCAKDSNNGASIINRRWSRRKLIFVLLALLAVCCTINLCLLARVNAPADDDWFWEGVATDYPGRFQEGHELETGLLDYAATTHPDLRRHLSVQASASNPEAIRFYVENFGVKRVVLPRVLTVAEIADLNKEIDVETEVFVFGGLCVMAEGRCALSSYATGISPNKNGACSPASHVHYEDEGDRLVSKLGDFTINAFDANEPAGYPTLCKGRFIADGKTSYLFEEPTSLSIGMMLPELQAAGVTALKIEGRQRGRAYVAAVVESFRRAVDAVHAGETPPPMGLEPLMEGQQETKGVYEKNWR